MPSINFTMFPEKVEDGTKCQTIRARTSTIKAGDPLYLFTGMRTKECRKLKMVICKSVTDIFLMERLAQPRGNVALTGIYLEEFAQADGFACYADMWDFFSKRANNEGEFHGKLIKW